MLDALSDHLGELELSKLPQVDYESPVWEKWQTPDCSQIDTVCTVNMDSHDEYFAYQRKVEEHNHKVDRWEENHMTVNSLLFLHCNPDTKAILKAHKNWDPTDQNDCLALLFTIGDVMNDTIREFSKKEKENLTWIFGDVTPRYVTSSGQPREKR